MRSIHLDLEQHVKNGYLQFHSSRPTLYGLEMHLVVFYKLIKQFKPKIVILDPITNLVTVGENSEVKSILIRLIDFLQNEQITVMFTALTFDNPKVSNADEEVSSLVDNWLSVRDIEYNGERNRGIYILKSRGMKNSNQVREFIISNNGIEIVEVAIGPSGVLTGSARESYKLEIAADKVLRQKELEGVHKEIENKKTILDARIADLTSQFELEKEKMNHILNEEKLKKEIAENNRTTLLSIRGNKKEKISKRNTI